MVNEYRQGNAIQINYNLKMKCEHIFKRMKNCATNSYD